MKIKNILLVSPILMSTSLMLTGCKEEDKKDTKIPMNLRIENKVLKWDLDSGIESPITEVKLNDEVVIETKESSLDLNSYVSYTGKLNVTLTTKPSAFKSFYKKNVVNKTFDVKSLNLPKVEFYSEGFEISVLIDGIKNENRYFEVYKDGKMIDYSKEKLEIYYKETQKAIFQIKEVSKDPNIFDSDFISQTFIKLDTPKVRIENDTLKWDEIPNAFSYGVSINNEPFITVDENELNLKFSYNKGDTFSVCAMSDRFNFEYLNSNFSESVTY